MADQVFHSAGLLYYDLQTGKEICWYQQYKLYTVIYQQNESIKIIAINVPNTIVQLLVHSRELYLSIFKYT